MCLWCDFYGCQRALFSFSEHARVCHSALFSSCIWKGCSGRHQWHHSSLLDGYLCSGQQKCQGDLVPLGESSGGFVIILTWWRGQTHTSHLLGGGVSSRVDVWSDNFRTGPFTDFYLTMDLVFAEFESKIIPEGIRGSSFLKDLIFLPLEGRLLGFTLNLRSVIPSVWAWPWSGATPQTPSASSCHSDQMQPWALSQRNVSV